MAVDRARRHPSRAFTPGDKREGRCRVAVCAATLFRFALMLVMSAGVPMAESSQFQDILRQDLRWPTPDDKPFVEPARWEDIASIVEDEFSRMVGMMIGYKSAADLMVERATADNWHRNTLVYPIIFNYRHFIELSLKYLIYSYGHTVGVDSIWNSHDLDKIWKRFRDVIVGYGGNDSDASSPDVERIIAEFAKVDPGSFSHRYPVDTKGDPIPVEHDNLDLAVLADVMQAVENYFSACDGYLQNLQQAGP